MRRSDWIRVEDKLPSDHTAVLIFCDSSHLAPGHFTYWLSVYDGDTGKFCGYDVWEDTFEPTHWMYLDPP